MNVTIITANTATRTIFVSTKRGIEFVFNFTDTERFLAAAEVLAECKGENGIFEVL